MIISKESFKIAKDSVDYAMHLECEIKKLQEQNKTMREALEKISTDTVEVGFYVEPTRSAQIAREAFAKVDNENN